MRGATASSLLCGCEDFVACAPVCGYGMLRAVLGRYAHHHPPYPATGADRPALPHQKRRPDLQSSGRFVLSDFSTAGNEQAPRGVARACPFGHPSAPLTPSDLITRTGGRAPQRAAGVRCCVRWGEAWCHVRSESRDANERLSPTGWYGDSYHLSGTLIHDGEAGQVREYAGRRGSDLS